MKKIKRNLSLFLLTILALSFTACGSGEDSPEGTPRTITVAVAPGFYPITYADDDGNAAGYDVAVMKAVDELLEDFTFTFEIADKETMNVGVQTGTYQIGINSLFKTETRLQTYLIPENNMGYTAVGIIYREGTEEITGFQDVYDRKLTIHPTSASGSIKNVIETWNSAHPDAVLDIELISVISTAEEIAAVKAGEYDVTVDLIPVFNLFDDETRAGLTVSAPVEVVPTFPIINKNEETLSTQVDEALAKLKEDGTLSKLSNEYFGYDVFNVN